MRVEVRSSEDVNMLIGWMNLPPGFELYDGQIVMFRKKLNASVPIRSDFEIEVVEFKIRIVCEGRGRGREPYCWKVFHDDGLTIDQLHEIKGFIECDHG